MCGIIGFNWENRSLLKRASAEISHRGPDDYGYYTDEQVSLGHRRLSIVDLSRSGRQPMSDKEGSIWIVFNGEIYNHKELRLELEKDYDFRSNTDTEVLIYLYRKYGTSFLEKLQGMFAFCIYDSKKKLLFMARDRLGIKPLYYYLKDGHFIFSSEIKAILKEDSVIRAINPEAMKSFLTFRANIEEETIFKDIRKLRPGHLLLFNLKSNELKIQKYWDLKFENVPGSYKFYEKEVRRLLEDSVKSRLMADVPYGAYLSGGVDSGVIVSLMQKYSPKTIKTFSVGFNEEKHSEAKEARSLAAEIGTDHHELMIDEKSIKNLPDVIYHLDEPMSDPTSLPIYLLSKYAKKYATVILTGEGSDEIFAGYPQYKLMKMHDSVLRKIPGFLRSPVPKLAGIMPDFIKDKGFRFASSLGKEGVERFSNFLRSDSKEEQYLELISIFNRKESSEVLMKKEGTYNSYKRYFADSYDVVSGCQNLDINGPMVEDLLMKVDKNTMAFGVEGRVPFLDYRLAELSLKIPSEFKLRGLTKDKYILRNAVRDLLPSKTRERKKKHFFVPIDRWFSKELSPLAKDLLSPEFLSEQGLFSQNYVSKVRSNFKGSKLFYSRQMWSLITFQIWYKQYIKGEKVKI